MTSLTLQKPFTELAEHAETSFCLLCVLSALGGERLSQMGSPQAWETAVTTLSAGARLAQYEIVGPIGSGGMGEVYRARDPRLDRDVAIKVMAPHVAADPEMRRRFETEARAIAALSHPSIMAIHELAIVDNKPVAVMDLLEGHTLRARLAQGAVPWHDVVHIGASIAEGLAAAHARGVIHRDLKPENVFLTNDAAVRILDFGLALRRLELPALDAASPTLARTAPHTVLGTLGYMSPEQVSGDRVDGRSGHLRARVCTSTRC